MGASSGKSVRYAHRGTVEHLAIVGIGCRLPGGIASPQEYWDFLVGRKCAISEIPPDRWSIDGFYSEEPNAIARSTAKWGGFLENVRRFDAEFFGITPREAASMDPQQRLLLHVVCEALEDSWLTLEQVCERKTGVFVGVSTSDYGNIQRYRRTNNEVYAGTGSALSIVANRISHRLNLSGPSFAVDTACSSSLVALDQACLNLHQGSCDAAVAAGVNVLADPSAFVAFSKAGMLSPTGRISTFDARANGYVRGEGVGAVIIKRLADAQRDGDRIYSLIRATAVNQDGRTPTLTAPDPDAQAEMLTSLCERADVHPHSVGYVEAHGTGTPTGDPVEAGVIGRIFGEGRTSGPVHVGSVKPNLGHLESAAGISGLIKTSLSLWHRTIAPNIHFEKPNPNIPFDVLNMVVPQQPVCFAQASKHGLAVVNSFGFGGTNASVLLEQACRDRTVAGECSSRSITVKPDNKSGKAATVIPISASSEAALAQVCDDLATALDSGGLAEHSLGDLAASLGTYRAQLPQRLAIVASSHEDLKSKLALVAKGEEEELEKKALRSIVRGKAAAKRPNIAFTFSGQGGQWWGMARKLLTEAPVFQRVVDEFDECFKPISGWSIQKELLRSEQASRIHDSAITQPGIFAVQIGLAEMWRQSGINPDVVIGHSFGEVAAAKVAGALDLENAARLICFRGQMRTQLGKDGAMLAVSASPDYITELLESRYVFDFAAFNGPASTTIAGTPEVIADVEAYFASEAAEVRVKRLAMDTAWHSRELEPGESWFRNVTKDIVSKVPEIPVISTVTGKLHVNFESDYWWQNLRRPVSYQQAVDLALEMGADMFIELAPHRTLSGLTSSCADAAGKSVSVINSIYRGADDHHAMALAIGEAYTGGAKLNWPKIPAGEARRLPLPNYRWDCQEYWSDSEESRWLLEGGHDHPLLGRRLRSPTPQWKSEINLTAMRYLDDHRVDGDCVFPGAGYIEMMLQAGVEHLGKLPLEISDLTLSEALFIGPDDDVLLSTSLNERTSLISIYSRLRDGPAEWKLRATAKLSKIDFPAPKPIKPGRIVKSKAIGKQKFYETAKKFGFDYGATFNGLSEVQAIGKKISAHIRKPDELKDPTDQYNAHPALLDVCFQTVLAAAIRDLMRSEAAGQETYPVFLPTGASRIRLFGAMPDEAYVKASVKSGEPTQKTVDYTIADMQGGVSLTVEGFALACVDSRKPEAADEKAPCIYEETFIKAANCLIEDDRLKHFLVIAGKPKITGKLVAHLKSKGHGVNTVSPKDFAALDCNDLADLVHKCSSNVTGPLTIIYAEPLLLHDKKLGADTLTDDTEQSVLALLRLGQCLKLIEAEDSALDVRVLTADARSFMQQDTASLAALAQGADVPFIRTIANECDKFFIQQIDCQAENLTNPELLSNVLCSRSKETELVLRGEDIWVPRIEAREPESLKMRQVPLDTSDPDVNFAVTMASPGSLSGIEIVKSQVPACEADKVLVETAAVGLNFRDIMAATGLLPAAAEKEPAWLNLGLEFSGTVRSVADGVSNLKPGDRVIGMGRHCLQRVQSIPANALVKLPDNVGLVEGSTIPSVFCTAHYALNHVARIKKGDKVLIHAATGGVGLAAIQLAKRAGAEIFATAGNNKKRAYLRKLGIKHVMDSRSLAFADGVMKATKGQGVDIILNSLPGEFITKGLDILSPFGSFLEIGKRDVYNDSAIGLKALRRNISLSVIDLAAMAVERPDLLAQLFTEVMELFAAGELHSLPHELFDVNETKEAFRFMSRARHIGKVVVSLENDEVQASLPKGVAPELLKSACYLVTGASRGFGVAVADWLSRQGAGTVILASRSGKVDNNLRKTIKQMQQRGTVVNTVALDVSDFAAVDGFIAELKASGKPLDGVFHGAAVIHDGFLEQLDEEQVLSVLRPKITGAWNLERAMSHHGVEPHFFVSFSSLSQMIGAIGQGCYVAANGFLDSLSFYRKASGKTALTVDWGALGDTGFIARNDALSGYMESVGITPLSNKDATHGLATLMQSDMASVAYAAIDWNLNVRSSGGTSSLPRFAHVCSGVSSGSGRIRSELPNVPENLWAGILLDFMVEEVCKVLKIERDTVDVERPLTEMGFDSLSSIELKNRIESQLGLSISVGVFLQTPTLVKLADILVVAMAEEIRTKEAGQSSTKENTDAASGKTGNAFVVSDRQNEIIQLALAPMSSDALRLGLQHCIIATLPTAVTPQQLNNKLSRLARRHSLIKLQLAPQSDYRSASLVLGKAPKATEVTDIDDENSRPLNIDAGELVRVALSREGKSRTRMAITAHGAVMDQPSLQQVVCDLAELCIADKLSGASSAKCVQRHVKQRMFDDENYHHVAARSFLQALLDTPLPPVRFSSRRRAIAPFRLGQDQGQPLRYKIELRAKECKQWDQSRKEAALMAVFASAIDKVAQTQNVLLARYVSHCPKQGAAGPFEQIMPFPVDLSTTGPKNVRLLHTVDRLAPVIESSGKHNAACDILASGQLDEALRQQGALPMQFGFRFEARDTRSGIDGNKPFVDLHDARVRLNHLENAGCLHDVAVSISETRSGFSAELSFDEDVLTTRQIELFVDSFLSGFEALQSQPAKVKQKAPAKIPVTSAAPVMGKKVATKRAVNPREKFDFQLAAQMSSPADKGKAQTPSPQAVTKAALVLRPGDAETFDIYPNQQFILNLLEHPDCTATFRSSRVLQRCLLFKPSLNVTRLQKALSVVMKRHDALRSTFFKQGDRWKTRIFATADAPLKVRDLGDVSREVLLAEVRSVMLQTIDIATGPLLEVHLLKTQRHGDCLLARVHHLITDATSIVVLLEELIKSYLGLPVIGSAMKHSDYLRRIADLHKSADIKKMDQYWRQFYDRKPLTNKVGRWQRGLTPNAQSANLAPFQELQLSLDLPEFEDLARRAKTLGITPFSLFAASYVETLCDFAGQDQLAVNSVEANRGDDDIKKFIGYLSSYCPVICDLNRGLSTDQLAVEMHQEMMRHRMHIAPGYAMPVSPGDIIKGGRVGMSSTLPVARTNKSPFSKIFQSLTKQKFSAFSFEVEPAPIRLPILGAFEILLRATFLDGVPNISLNYDLLAFDKGQSEDILRSVLANLGLSKSSTSEMAVSEVWGNPEDVKAYKEGRLLETPAFGNTIRGDGARPQAREAVREQTP